MAVSVSHLNPGSLLPFVDAPGLAVVHVCLTLGLPLNRALLPRLAILEEPVRVGQVDLLALVRSNGTALSALRHALRRLGARGRIVLPGYYLFDDGRLLAFEGGLPTPGDARRIARGTLLGLLFSALQRRSSLRGLDLSVDDAVAKRMATRFRRALRQRRTRRVGAAPQEPISLDPLTAAYALLGVAPTASDHAVRDAWRRKLVAVHPDRAARDAREVARRTRRAAELNRAYEIVTQHRLGDSKRQSTGS